MSAGADTEVCGNFLFVRCTAECVLEVGDRVLNGASTCPHRTWNPVERAQAVENRPTDARHRVGLELHTVVGVEFVDGVHQTEHTRAHEVGRVDRLR